MKKIMFNDKYGLTKAVLEGRKTQTRRVIKDLDKLLFYDFGTDDNRKQYASFMRRLNYMFGEDDCFEHIIFPYQVGDVVAIAQAYKDAGVDCDFRFAPAISKEQAKMLAGWSNKMFVKSELMPHHIKITNVRVERLQAISEEDCMAEGIYEDQKDAIGRWVNRFGFDDIKDPYGHWYNTPKEAYSVLIDKVGKKGTWESNSWVFVYEFELID